MAGINIQLVTKTRARLSQMVQNCLMWSSHAWSRLRSMSSDHHQFQGFSPWTVLQNKSNYVCLHVGRVFPQPNGNFFASSWEFFRGSTIFWCRNPKPWSNPSIELAPVQHISGRSSCWIPTAYCLLVKKLELFGETSRNNQVKIKWPHLDARHMAHMSHMTPYLTALPLDHVSFTYNLWQWFKPILTQIVSDSVSCGLLLVEDS